MTQSIRRIIAAGAATLIASNALAGDSPQDTRHELMEGVRDAAKVLGAMLKGEQEFDNAAAMESLRVWQSGAARFGGLFPEGSQGGEAAEAIWNDRAGFDAALAEWADAIDTAIAADPATLEEGKPVIGAAFSKCKNCHDDYRIESE
jgi:cytochrome c556